MFKSIAKIWEYNFYLNIDDVISVQDENLPQKDLEIKVTNHLRSTGTVPYLDCNTDVQENEILHETWFYFRYKRSDDLRYMLPKHVTEVGSTLAL